MFAHTHTWSTHGQQVSQLRSLGFDVAARAGMEGEAAEAYQQRHTVAATRPADDVQWDFMVGQLQDWKDRFLTCIVPRQVGCVGEKC